MPVCFCTGECYRTGKCAAGGGLDYENTIKPPFIEPVFEPVIDVETWRNRAGRAERKLSEAEAAIEHLKERLAKVTGERNTLAGHLQDIYAHPAATPPILAIASGALEAFNFAKPPRWASLDH